MTKCPYCGKSFTLADFFDIEERVLLDNYHFKGLELENRSDIGEYTKITRMWSCPHCDTFLAVTESNWS